jgi:hypothetical protein
MSTKPNVYTLPVSAPMPQLYQVVCLSPGDDIVVRERESYAKREGERRGRNRSKAQHSYGDVTKSTESKEKGGMHATGDERRDDMRLFISVKARQKYMSSSKEA